MNTFETSETTAKLDAALAKAQGEFEAASKATENEAFKRGGKASKYADLSAVWTAIRPALSKHGIALTQWPVHSEDNKLHMITRLAHDGEWIRAEFSIPVDKTNAHGYGSATTYAKRFSLAAAVGVIVDDDDDGNNAIKGVPSNGNGFPAGNPDVKYYKTAATTPGAVKAQDNNAFYKQLEREIDEFKTKADAREWRKFRERDIDERVSPEAMMHLSERYEERLAALP